MLFLIRILEENIDIVPIMKIICAHKFLLAKLPYRYGYLR